MNFNVHLYLLFFDASDALLVTLLMFEPCLEAQHAFVPFSTDVLNPLLKFLKRFRRQGIALLPPCLMDSNQARIFPDRKVLEYALPRNRVFLRQLGRCLGAMFRQMKDGRTVVAAAPDFSDRIFSEAQLSNQSRFQQAVAYAREAVKLQPIYTERTRKSSSNAYNLALSDWYNPPVIHSVTRQEGCILVAASDNVQVTQVLITIYDGNGQILEQGQARLVYEGRWEYSTSAPMEAKLTVDAFDLPGNITKYEA